MKTEDFNVGKATGQGNPTSAGFRRNNYAAIQDKKE